MKSFTSEGEKIDTQILQAEIEAVQEGLLAVDAKVDELEELTDQETASQPGDSSSTPVEVTIDLAQEVGRLQGELTGCLSRLSALETSREPEVIPMPEPEPEPEIPMVAEVEVPEEPEPEGESGDRTSKNPNWLERLLLVQ